MTQQYNTAKAEELCSVIKDYISKSVKTGAEKEDIKNIDVQNLINWGILRSADGILVPTNAFILMTDNSFPFIKIQCALFKGTERVVFIDKKEFDGPLYKQVEDSYQFVLKHIHLSANIEGLIRKENYEIPTEALREAIVNAVVHRNLLDKSCIQVAVYDDRVEITSPGMLYGGLTIEQIKEGGSKIRNRCIAEIFSRMRIIENWGTGIKRMFASCREYGIQEPEISEIGDSFRVNLYRPSYTEGRESAPKDLNATKGKIMKIFMAYPEITQEEISEKLRLSLRAIKKNTRELTEKGYVRRVGSARKGHWEITREN